MLQADERLKIAIIGAGVAGLAAAIALQTHEGIDVNIYERATELREVGASIALGPNGMRTLERLGVHDALRDDIAIRNHSGHPFIYRHWQTNEIISVDKPRGEVEDRHQMGRFYRPHLQQALAVHVEPGRLHLHKAFHSVETLPDSDAVSITFADGSKETADILLGADGIHSAVRRFFVPSSTPKWTGWVAFRSTFDVTLVEHIPEILGEANHWWGPDRVIFGSRLGQDLFCVVGGTWNDPDATDAEYKDAIWNSDGDMKALRGFYKDWHPVIRKMIDASPYTRMYPNTFASGLDTWIHGTGQVTFAGDAAHAHGGAFAAGGSLALDDAWAFARSILHFYPPGSAKPDKPQILRALKVYERARKAHTDRVRATVRANNETSLDRLRLGHLETDDELRHRMKNRPDLYWIHEHDVESVFAQAVSHLETFDEPQAHL